MLEMDDFVETTQLCGNILRFYAEAQKFMARTGLTVGGGTEVVSYSITSTTHTLVVKRSVRRVSD